MKDVLKFSLCIVILTALSNQVFGQKVDTLAANKYFLAGEDAVENRDIRKAQEQFSSALKEFMSVFPSGHSRIGEAYYNVGFCNGVMGNHRKAIINYQNAIQQFEIFYPKNHYFLGYAKLAISSELMYENLDSVIVYTKQIINDFGKESDYAAKAIGGLAFSYNLRGYTDSAAYYYKIVLPILEKNYKDSPENLIYTYNNIGIFYQNLGDLEKANKFYEKTLTIILNASPEQRIQIHATYNSLANVASKMGKYQKSNQYYEKVRQHVLKHFGSDSNYLYKIDEGVGANLFRMGKYREAVPFFKKGLRGTLSERGEMNNKSGIMILNLALCYSKLEEYALAKPLFLRAMDIGDSLNHVDNYRLKGDAEYGLAFMLMKMNQNKEALELYKKALRTKGFNFEQLVYPSEMEGFKKEMVINLTYFANLLYEKAKEENDVKKLMESTEIYEVAGKLLNEIQNSLVEDVSKLAVLEKNYIYFEKAILPNLEMYRLTQNRQFLEKVFEIIELGKSYQLKKVMTSNRTVQYFNIPDSLLLNENRKKREIIGLKNSINKQKLKGKTVLNSEKYRKLTDKLFEEEKYLKAIIEAIKDADEKYFTENYLSQTISIENLVENLEGNQVLLEYFLGDSSLIVLAIDATNNMQYHHKKIDSIFHQNLSGLQTILQNSKAATQAEKLWLNEYYQFIELSQYFYHQLILPVAPNLKSQDLIIIPSGKLSYLPFEILLTQQPSQTDSKNQAYENLPYLFLNHNIRYEYSAKMLAEKPLRKRLPSIQYLGFAADYSPQIPLQLTEEDSIRYEMIDPLLVSRGYLRELPYAEEEIRTAANYMDADPLPSENATKEYFLRIASDAAILHLAMHGKVHDKDPLFSRLFFTSTKDTTNNNQLYAYELYNMELNADLVVLSACNTGFGEIQRGEGVMSLSRAFKYAGCPNVVMNLWQANDYTSKEIIGAFFANLSQGQGKLKALKEAQKEHLAAYKKAERPEKTNHPHYWANFVLIGDDLPLQVNYNPIWYWVVGGLTLLMLLLWWRKKN